MPNPLMRILQRINKRYSVADLDDDMDLVAIGRAAATGVMVTEGTALYSTAVWACVRLLAETTASLPLPVYRRLKPRGKERASDHHLYDILHNAPNPEMSSFSFREALQGHLATWGNAYAEIEWAGNGQVKALWPLRPDKMRVARQDGEIKYVYMLPDGTQVVLSAWRIFHIPGFGYDGLVGYSPIRMAREAIGLSLATEEFGARFFGNGAQPGGALRHPGRLDKPARENLRKSWEQAHKGLSNQHRIAVLEEGMDYKQIGIPPEDAQFLQTRQFQVNEIARFYHIPPHMIGDLDRATYSNIEQQSIEFVVYTMRPWLTRWEQTITRKLLIGDDSTKYFAEFLIEGLLRGDSQSRAQYYKELFYMGSLSPNDIREKENMNPIDGGDEYYVPLNMVPVSMAEAIKLPEAKGRNPITEKRGNKRGALIRHRTAASYRRVFADAGKRIVEREKNNILRAAKKHLSSRDSLSFEEWLNDFYRDFPEYITKQIKSAMFSLAEAIQPLAAEEIGADSRDIKQFLQEYIAAFNARYTGSSRGQIRFLLREAADANTDPIEAIEGRLDEWEQRRPNKVAMNETVQLSNAVARTVFAGGGIREVVWMAVGSDICPFCEEMDGKVVGIEQEFVSADTTLEAEGKSDMQINRPASHPPLHNGCECQISSG